MFYVQKLLHRRGVVQKLRFKVLEVEARILNTSLKIICSTVLVRLICRLSGFILYFESFNKCILIYGASLIFYSL